MKPNDVVIWRDPSLNLNRFWQVKSVCLGAEGQESLVELESLNETPGTNTEGVKHKTTWVPEVLVRGMVYSPSLSL